MSKVFYDHLINFEEVELIISKSVSNKEDRGKISEMIEETIHYRVVSKILTHLPKEHHRDFLERFHKAPYDENIITYLKEKVEGIEDFIKGEIDLLKKETIEDLKHG